MVNKRIGLFYFLFLFLFYPSLSSVVILPIVETRRPFQRVKLSFEPHACLSILPQRMVRCPSPLLFGWFGLGWFLLHFRGR
jgi:hypothetical protein